MVDGIKSNLIESRAKAALIDRNDYEKMEKLDAIHSIQTSLEEMAAGKTLPPWPCISACVKYEFEA